MSMNDAFGFVKTVLGDQELLLRLQGVDEKTAIRSARERGFDVAPGEIGRVMDAAAQEGAVELNEAQLDAVAGGLGKVQPFLGYTATDDLWDWRKNIDDG